MEYIEARFMEFATTFAVLEVVGLVFLLAIVSETVWDFWARRRAGAGETFANFAIGVVNLLLERTVYGLVFVLGLFMIEPFALFSIPSTWWNWGLAIILADFIYYWMHRFEHEVRILWSYHSVHHSSPEFNLTTALRLAWVEGLIEWIFFIAMILLGFSAVQTIAALSVVVAYQTWIHTEKVGKLGWADRIFNTPSVHRVHHGCNARYIDKNYGGILIIWDRLFGTYQAEDEKVVYGITTPLGTSNPITINFAEFWQIVKDVLGAGNIRDALGYIFGRPGWTPKDGNSGRTE